MKKVQLRWALPLCLVAISCESATPNEPGEKAIPAFVSGDYQLEAAGETVSDAWERFTIRLEGTMRLEQDPLSPSKLSGAFEDLRIVEDGSRLADRRLHGLVSGSIDGRGNVHLQLRSQSEYLEWAGRGILVASSIAGQWKTSSWNYDAAGGFTARLISD